MFHTTVYSNKLNLNLYDSIESAVFIKNKHSRYLWANSFFIRRSAGCRSIGEIKNKMDYDFPWREQANELKANDETVLSACQSQSHYERIIRHDGTFVNILTRKSPLIDTNKQLIGVVGFSIELPQPNKTALLSTREKECVYFLSIGYTDKKIAKQLNISPRTVETHLLAAKRRLSVATRAELIAIFCRVYP
jgi:DNA-binding CsgD family transcriptional regulator